jgi:hypothetical protein
VTLIFTKLTTRGVIPPKRGLKKLVGQWKKRGYKEMAGHWHRFFRPKHFTWEGAREYRYRRRKTKPFRKPGTLPLVHTGDSRRLLMRRNIRATKFQGIVKLRAPNLSRRGFPAREVKRVSGQEWKTLAKVWDKRLVKSIRRYKAVKTERL